MTRARRSASPLAVVAVAAVFVLGLSIPASAAAGTTVYVVPADLSSVNISESAVPVKWDAPSGKPIAPAPAPGSKWVLDTENKPKGTATITADGLVLAVAVVPEPQKVRYQYYVGSGGYPTIDTQHPTLNTLLASPITWDLKLISGTRTVYGPVFQVQLQKLLPDGVTYARVTVQTVWNPEDGTRDLQNGLWFSNTTICTGGYTPGTASYAACPGAVANAAGSGPGVSAAVLAENFGTFDVVSFGPNLGRDYPYSFAFQNLTALGHTFVFVTQLPAAPVTPPTSGSTTTTPPVTTSRTTNSGELPTFALPTATPTPTPSPSQSEEPAAPSDDDGDGGDDVVVADPPIDDGGGFPAWLLLLGVGFLVLVLAFLVWLLRRRAA